MFQPTTFQNLQKLLSSNLNTQITRNIKNKMKTTLNLEESSLKDINQIEIDIFKRKSNGNIKLIQELLNQTKCKSINNEELEFTLQQELKKLPNKTHPEVLNYGEEPYEVASFNDKPHFNFKPKQFSEICKKNNLLRTEHLGNFTGTKTYYLMSDLAELVSMYIVLLLYKYKSSICRNLL